MFEDLFNPITIRGLKLNNRIMLPAIGTKMAGEDKFVTRRIIDFHLARVRGGCGLNFTEACGIHEESTPIGFLSIGHDRYVPMLKVLTKEVHKNGGKIGLQLWQGGIAVSRYQDHHIFVPSNLSLNSSKEFKAMTKEEIKMIVKAYGEAARRAVEAGFDTIEFHAGHNYLPHTFLSGGMNFREDEYGGSLENRMRFPLECIQAIRENMPEEMPLFMRVVALDDNLENGLTLDETVEFCKRAKEAGVDIVNVSRGNLISRAMKYEVPPVELPRGFNVDNAQYIREKAKIKTVAVGRINDPRLANEIIRDKKSDMVAIGRAQLADPEFAKKTKEDRAIEIVRCIGCNQGCYDGFINPKVPFISCLRNPAVGMEVEFAIEESPRPKKVMVIGAGLAGLEAALVLKQRGHYPVIFEKSNCVGGQFTLAGEAPKNLELRIAASALGKQAKLFGVNAVFNTEARAETIREEKPDEVIIAIGSKPLIPNIKGMDKSHVIDSYKVLLGDRHLEGEVLIIGGGTVGLEVAEYLSSKNLSVTIIEMSDQVGKNLGPLRKITVLDSLEEKGIRLLTDTRCKEILDQAVLVEIDGEERLIPADNVVLSIGSEPRDTSSLIEACKELSIPYHIIGDAKAPRNALKATYEAMEVATRI